MERLFIRSRDRRTGYTAFVFSQLPVGLDDELILAAVKDFGTDRAAERFRTIEFQDLLNQEYNLALFRMQITNTSSKRLAKDLEKYIQQLGGSL